MNSTITIGNNSGVQERDYLSMTVLDRRWSIRFWHWVTFRGSPTRTEYIEVVSIDSSTTLTVKKKGI